MSKLILLAAVAAATLATGAKAETIAALTGDATLLHIDAATAKVGKTVTIKGLPGAVVGIDVRPSDGLLYALASDGTVATIDPATGTATVKSKLDKMLAAGVGGSVDFNPVADRMRIIGTDGANLRANVDDGKVTADKNLVFADTDAGKGKPATVIAGAYTNSVKGAKETALFDIDASGLYVKQAPPNDGILNSVGATGVTSKTIAFDIVTDAAGVNTGWLVADGMLYKVDVASGKTSGAVKISGATGAIRDIAVLPQ